MKRLFILTGLILAWASTLAGSERPNILVILADDLGYGDVSCYNPERGKIPTPNIDKLASQGMRFTDGHSSSGVCTPTRYTLLTGRYSWRGRLKRGVLNGYGAPLIEPGRLTLPGFLRSRGYTTAMFGKWHLGLERPNVFRRPPGCTPNHLHNAHVLPMSQHYLRRHPHRHRYQPPSPKVNRSTCRTSPLGYNSPRTEQNQHFLTMSTQQRSLQDGVPKDAPIR